jgi:DNA-binding NarL/FixJ family response regulator
MSEVLTPETAERYLRPHEIAYLKSLMAAKPTLKRGQPTYLAAEIRAYLKQHREGKTIKEIAQETGRACSTVRNALERMDDAWVERYVSTGTARCAIWRVVPSKTPT